jgi:hypothetical protein
VSEQRDDAVTDDGTTGPFPEASPTPPPAPSEAAPATDASPGPAGPPPASSAADPAAADPAAATRLRLRRAPRYRRFGLTGALIGVIAGVILALSFPVASNYSMQTIAGYFAAILGLIGTVLGLGLSVLIERRSSPDR